MENQHKRILALDLIKGCSVIMMVIVHTLIIYGSREAQAETFFGNFIRFLGKAPGIFLICMGITFMTSRNQSLLSAIKRGGLLLLAALLMNFMKFMIPVMFDFVPDNYMTKFQWDAPIEWQYLYLVLLGDILHLAGMSLLFIGFIRTFVKNKFGILAIGLAVALVSRELHGLYTDIPVVNYVLDLIFHNEFPAYVYFPVFPWITFIILGMFFGKWFIEVNYDQAFLFKKIFIAGIIFVVLGLPLVYYYPEYHYNDFYYMGLGGVLYSAGLVLLALWLVYLLSFSIKQKAFVGILNYCSRNLTSMYIIQWTLISWGKGIFGFRESGAVEVLLLIPLYMALTFLVQKLLDELIHIFKSKKDTVDLTKQTV
ncbi:heparan-alpha-glucosaminide N-acetyltransferase domain-containing protein [Rapidithrix thailandica]|uniref:Heparan-alpha-glucosaminide N-acetyltransferase domain-containing protein n=1 Tax=Rapidithrix thailandica TaxID=413964 RepID=A0AAW9S5I3_9BACT